MTIEELAGEIADELGRSALDDQLRLVERLEGAGLPCGGDDAERLADLIQEELDDATAPDWENGDDDPEDGLTSRDLPKPTEES